jgi:hypothetical protein
VKTRSSAGLRTTHTVRALVAAAGLAALVPALAACGGPKPPRPQPTAVRRAPLAAGGIGSACDGDRDCAPSAACYDAADAGKSCLCRPGLVACGPACFDASTDPNNCGGCGRRCAPGTVCASGVCGPQPAPGLQTALGPVGVTPYDASVCSRATELFPEVSTNALPRTFGVTNYFKAGAPDSTMSWAQELGAWSNLVQKPAMGVGMCGTSDPWATTSGYSGLEYVSFRAVACKTTDGGCIGVAATPASGFDTNEWSYPVTCFNQINEADDGQVIHFDIGGTTLWAAAPHPPAWSYYLYAAPDCRTGQPGGPECPLADLSPNDPRTKALDVTGNNGAHNTMDGHPDLAVNPCTHHAIASYRTGGRDRVDPGAIKLSFVTPTGVVVNTYTVARVGAFIGNDACAGGGTCTKGNVCKCGGATSTSECTGQGMSCLRIVPRVQLATTYDAQAQRCLAYVSFDYADGAIEPHRFRSMLQIVDVTDESKPSVVRTMTTSAPPGGQTFNAIPTASAFSRNAGWFFYFDDGSHCNTTFTGYVDSNLLLLTQRPLLVSQGAFPTFGGTVVLGDYVAAIKRGLPGGYLFPTWSQPVPGPASCSKCQGRTYNTRGLGAPVLP